MILTALSRMSVVMNCEAARAVKPLPAVVTDMFPCLVVVKIIRVYRTGRFRRRRSAPGIRFPSKTQGNDGCRRQMVFQVRAGVPSVKHELRGDGTGAHSEVVTLGFDEICKRG